jgi:hypothetical protein
MWLGFLFAFRSGVMAEKEDPWPSAQEALFSVIRCLAREFPDGDRERVAGECLEIMMKVNETKGAPFIFVCELARTVVTVLAKYLCVCDDEFPDVGRMLAEIENLELEYIEEFVVAEESDDGVAAEE